VSNDRTIRAKGIGKDVVMAEFEVPPQTAGARDGIVGCVEGSIPDVTEFFNRPNPSSRTQYGLGFDSASNRNEYHESSWG
jgi:hypothetical protein